MSQPAASVPTLDTSKDYIDYLARHVQSAVAAWETFVDLASKVYTKAYEKQGRLLRHIKERLDADRKKDEAILSFAISLITVGAAGPIAGALAGKLAGGANLEKEAAEAFTKWARAKVESGVKAGTGATVKYLYPESLAPDPFEPAEDSPLVYMTTMLERIHSRKRKLLDQIDEWADEKMTPQAARSITVDVVSSSFIKERPPKDIENYEDALRSSASLALWIGWAYARDVAYWKDRSDDLNQEAMEFDPLRIELGSLGVPQYQITLKPTGKRMYGGYMTAARYGSQTGLNMEGFIEWATSIHGIMQVFKGLPNVEGVTLSREKMVKRMYMHAFGL